MSAHTPGPWAARFGETYFVTGPDLGRVAIMMNLKGAHGLGGRRSGDESAANARLIAAAPELLEALQEGRYILSIALRHAWEGSTDADVAEHVTIKRMDAAIAKAEGKQ